MKLASSQMKSGSSLQMNSLLYAVSCVYEISLEELDLLRALQHSIAAILEYSRRIISHGAFTVICAMSAQ